MVIKHTTWENAKDKIFPALVPSAPEYAICRPWKNLFEVIKISFGQIENNNVYGILHEQALTGTNVDTNTAFKIAEANALKQPHGDIVLYGLDDFYENGKTTKPFCQVKTAEDIMIPPSNTQMPIVATLKDTNNGSNLILNKIFLNKLHNAIGTFYIICSSKDELILLPETDNMDTNGLRRMIYDINRTDVVGDAFLSDELYYYDGHNVSIAP